MIDSAQNSPIHNENSTINDFSNEQLSGKTISTNVWKIVAIVLGIVAFGLILIIVFLLRTPTKGEIQDKQMPIQDTVSNTPQKNENQIESDVIETSNQITYHNETYDYTVSYPSTWVAYSGDPGVGNVPLNMTSRGLLLAPQGFNNYNDFSEVTTSIKIETDGDWNLANPTYESYLEIVKKPYFTVESMKEISFAGRQSLELSGSYDGYGYPAKIRALHFPSLDKKTYYSVTIISSDDLYTQEIENILSSFQINN